MIQINTRTISTASIEGISTYLLLTEFKGPTVSYRPSFFPIDFWPKHEVCRAIN